MPLAYYVRFWLPTPLVPFCPILLDPPSPLKSDIIYVRSLSCTVDRVSSCHFFRILRYNYSYYWHQTTIISWLCKSGPLCNDVAYYHEFGCRKTSQAPGMFWCVQFTGEYWQSTSSFGWWDFCNFVQSLMPEFKMLWTECLGLVIFWSLESYDMGLFTNYVYKTR